jgi:hypothetical protein
MGWGGALRLHDAVGKRLEAHQSGGRSLEGGFHRGTVEGWGLSVDWPERLSGRGLEGTQRCTRVG